MKAALAPERAPPSTSPASHSVVRHVGGLLLRQLAIGILLVLLVVGGLATYGWLRHNQQVILPQPRGNYAVGRSTFDWRDEGRLERFSSDPAAKRELMVWIWYPADKGSQGDPVEYLPDAWRRAIERSNGWLAPFLTQNLAQVHPHALANVADDATPAEAKAILNQLITIWAADNRFVLDQLAALNRNGGQPLAGRLDMSRIGLFGHSFGGASAAETCGIDARCVAGARKKQKVPLREIGYFASISTCLNRPIAALAILLSTYLRRLATIV